MRTTIKARDIKPGTVVAKSLDSETFTVTEAFLSKASGTFNGQEMTIRGKGGIVIKRDADAKVAVFA